MKKTKGIFIVLYGINGVGKTTQALNLMESICRIKRCVWYMKFPEYEILPTGPRINAYLRKGNPEKLTPEEFQVLCAQNRRDWELRIKEILAVGDVVIAEDWRYGGIAWGIATGVSEKRAYEMNSGFLKEDVPILLDGKQFAKGKEKGHTHEENLPLLLEVRKQYLLIASKEGWDMVSANRTEEKVRADIWNIVESALREKI